MFKHDFALNWLMPRVLSSAHQCNALDRKQFVKIDIRFFFVRVGVCYAVVFVAFIFRWFDVRIVFFFFSLCDFSYMILPVIFVFPLTKSRHRKLKCICRAPKPHTANNNRKTNWQPNRVKPRNNTIQINTNEDAKRQQLSLSKRKTIVLIVSVLNEQTGPLLKTGARNQQAAIKCRKNKLFMICCGISYEIL